VSNETQGWDVFFDNLSVQYKQGPVLEENHYYPFGLTMAGISDKALKANYAENKYRFQKQELQNKEFSDGSGLEMYEFKYRMDDPQIGRFWSVDPLANKYVYNSPYAFSENHVTSHVELEGLEKFPINEDNPSSGNPNSSIARSAKNQQAVESQRAAGRAAADATTAATPASNSKGSVSNDGSQPLVGTTSTTKVTNEASTGDPIVLGTTTVSNTTAVTKGTEGSIVNLDIVHKQTNEGVEMEGVGGNVGPLTGSFGADGSFSLGMQLKDEGSGTDFHASLGVGAMNGNGVLSAGMTSKGPGGVSTSVDASYTPGLLTTALTAIAIMSGGGSITVSSLIRAAPAAAAAAAH
jgi:RHS repeat-associated protein